MEGCLTHLISEEVELIVQNLTLCYGGDATVNVKLLKKSDETPYEVDKRFAIVSWIVCKFRGIITMVFMSTRLSAKCIFLGKIRAAQAPLLKTLSTRFYAARK